MSDNRNVFYYTPSSIAITFSTEKRHFYAKHLRGLTSLNNYEWMVKKAMSFGHSIQEIYSRSHSSIINLFSKSFETSINFYLILIPFLFDASSYRTHWLWEWWLTWFLVHVLLSYIETRSNRSILQVLYEHIILKIN